MRRDIQRTWGRRRAQAMVVATGLGMAVLSACGGNSASVASDAGGGDPAKLAAFEAKVGKLVADRSAEVTSPPPTTGPQAAAGKKVYVIACVMAAEGCARESRGAVEAGKALGWDMTLVDTQSLPDKMNAAVQQAIDERADGIVVQAIDMTTLAAPIAKAKAAGIHVVCFACINKDGLADQTVPSEQSFYQDGYALGAAMYKQTGGHPRLVETIDNSFGVVGVRYQGLDKFFSDCEAAGGDCKVLERINFLVTELTTRVPQLAGQIFRQHPDVNAISMPYDSAESFMSQGLRQAGAVPGKVGLYGFDGNSAQIGQIRKGDFEVATMAGPFEWFGWAEIDALNRLFQGGTPVDDVVKIRLITKDSLPTDDNWSGDIDYKPGYLKVWGVG